MKLRINRDIVYLYSLIILLMVAWFAYFSITNNKDFDALNLNVNKLMESNQALDDIKRSDFNKLMVTHTDFLINPTVEKMNLLIQQTNGFILSLGAKKPRLTGEINSPISELQTNLVAYRDKFVEFENVSNDNTLRTRLNRNPSFFEEFNTLLNVIYLDLQSARNTLSRQIVTETSTLPVILSNNFNLFLLLFTCVIIVSMSLGIFITRRITREINNVSEELHESSEEILLTANREEKTILEQSSSFDDTANSIEALSKSAGEVAENSHQVVQQMEQTSERMEDLKKKALQIGRISTTIEEITHQINILSLNASIEASRAGEQGKGFSAVATEIRKLADNTKGFTDNISVLISDIQDSINATVDFSNQSVELVRNINNSVDKQDDATEQIFNAITQLTENMRIIADNISGTVEASKDLNIISKKLKSMV
ncbi:methyl-accepting chemotaxis protein [candidate division KSB1 bacterium]